ncbi:hypothetical protein D3C87_1735990 [compost metagenome]
MIFPSIRMVPSSDLNRIGHKLDMIARHEKPPHGDNRLDSPAQQFLFRNAAINAARSPSKPRMTPTS